MSRPAFSTRHDAAWRHPAEVATHWPGASDVDPRLLRWTAQGAWWDVLAEARVTVLVTREDEHLAVALRATADGPALSYLRMPHPSGLAVDRRRGIVHVASTRNPNQVYDLMPVSALLARRDVSLPRLQERVLMPVRSRFFPGCLYLHDLALIGGSLHANAVGQNAIVRLSDDGHATRVWWPRCIERHGRPLSDQNYLQLNSIAAGPDVEGSYFTASTDRAASIRPGDPRFPVDRRGVIFSGRTRAPVVRGLTRPHSARLHQGRLWVDNSGYGEVGVAESGRFVTVARLPGWTRGLSLLDRVALVGTSRILPRFRRYAPGLDLKTSVCGLHAVDTTSGRILGSLIWPHGNQVFAVEALPSAMTSGFPFRALARRPTTRERQLFYAFQVAGKHGR